MARPAGLSWVVTGILIVGLTSLPMFGILRGIIQDRWILQNNPREFIYMGVMASLLFVPMAVALSWLTRIRWEPFPWRELGGWAICSLLSGWYGGPIMLTLRNHSSTAPGQLVEFKIVHHLKGLVEIRAIGESYDGIIFTCSKSLWQERGGEDVGTAPGLVYRGRLGLLWGEFKDK